VNNLRLAFMLYICYTLVKHIKSFKLNLIPFGNRDIFVQIMFNFKKLHIFKIASATMAAVFILNGAVYAGIYFSEKTSLRVPLTMKEYPGKLKTAMDEVAGHKRSGLKIPLSMLFLSSLPLVMQPVEMPYSYHRLSDSGNYAYHRLFYPENYAVNYKLFEYMDKRFLPEKEKSYTKSEAALTNIIIDVLSDLKRPNSTYDELVPIIMKFFKEINFDKLYEEAISVKKSGKISQHKAFIKKIMELIRERRFGNDDLKYDDIDKLNRIAYLQEPLIASLYEGELYGINGKAEILKNCLGTTDVFIITLRALGFEIEGAITYGHVFSVMPSFAGGKYAIADVGIDKLLFFDKEKFNVLANDFMLLKEGYWKGKNLKEMIEDRDKLFAMDYKNLIGEIYGMSDEQVLTMIYFYFQTMPYGMTSAIYCNLGIIDEHRVNKTLIDKAIEIYPNYGLANYILGEIYKNGGDNEKAKELFTKTIEIDPNYSLSYYELASIYNNEKDFETAMKFCNEGLEKGLHLPYGYYVRGRIFQGMNRNREAIESYEKAIALDHDYMKAYYKLVDFYRTIGDFENEEKTCDRIAKRLPNPSYIYYERAVFYEEKGEYKKAVTLYVKAMSVAKIKDQKVYTGIINCYKKIIDGGNQSLSIRTEYAEICCEYGSAYAEAGAHKEAIQLYDEAISKNKEYARAYYLLGKSYKARKEYDKAIDSYEEAMNRGRNDAFFYFDFAEAYNKRGGEGDQEKAKKIYSDIIKKYPVNSAYARYNIAIIDEKTGDYKNAARLYEELIKGDDHGFYVLAYCGLARIYVKMNDYENAIGKCKKAMKINPYAAEPYFELANIYKNKGELGKAIELYKKAFKINPQLIELSGSNIDKDNKLISKWIYPSIGGSIVFDVGTVMELLEPGIIKPAAGQIGYLNGDKTQPYIMKGSYIVPYEPNKPSLIDKDNKLILEYRNVQEKLDHFLSPNKINSAI